MNTVAEQRLPESPEEEAIEADLCATRGPDLTPDALRDASDRAREIVARSVAQQVKDIDVVLAELAEAVHPFTVDVDETEEMHRVGALVRDLRRRVRALRSVTS